MFSQARGASIQQSSAICIALVLYWPQLQAPNAINKINLSSMLYSYSVFGMYLLELSDAAIRGIRLHRVWLLGTRSALYDETLSLNPTSARFI